MIDSRDMIQKSLIEWLLDSTSKRRMQANIETVGKPSKWITLKALFVLKRLHGTKNEELRELLSKT